MLAQCKIGINRKEYNSMYICYDTYYTKHYSRFDENINVKAFDYDDDAIHLVRTAKMVQDSKSRYYFKGIVYQRLTEQDAVVS